MTTVADLQNKKTVRFVALPGDGIGPEVMASALKVVDWIRKNFELTIEVESALFGGCSIDKNGTPLTDRNRPHL